jgi:hypothetical protein
VVSRNAHNEFLDLKVNDSSQPGDEIHLEGNQPLRVRIEWRSVRNDLGRIELVQNGSVVAWKMAEVGPDSPAVFETTLAFRRSGWLAARRMDWQNGHRSHTGAVYVIVNNAPIRASASDAHFFVSWIDNLLKQSSPEGEWSSFFSNDREAAQARYRKARAIFLQREIEARQQGN